MADGFGIGGGAAALYGRLGGRALSGRGLFLNLGHWRAARHIDEACPALALLVAETAGMAAGEEVVDVGFGFGDQDMLWAERFAPRHITGLNVTPMQVRIARQRVRRRGLEDRITLREGSATAMPLPDACCDLVTAVECAFHFDTRAAFLAEAFRVLRPGGRLVLADVLRAEPAPGLLRRGAQALGWTAFERLLAVPAANADTRPRYIARLGEAGFERVSVRPIGEEVFPGWHGALARDAALRERLPGPARVAATALARVDPALVYAAFDYVLALAHKPQPAGTGVAREAD